MSQLTGKKVALLATDGFEDTELTDPRDTLIEAGAEVVVISDKDDTISGKNDTEVVVDKPIESASVDDYDTLLLPGGVVNPDAMRMNEDAVAFVKSFFDADKLVAAICHAPWLLAEADVLDGRTITSWPSLKTDMINAGAEWIDETVVVDGNLITSRNPDDIPDFNEKIIEALSAS